MCETVCSTVGSLRTRRSEGMGGCTCISGTGLNWLFLQIKVLVLKTPGIPTVSRPRNITNIIG